MIGGDNKKHITENSPFSPTSRKGKMCEEVNKMILDVIDNSKLGTIIVWASGFYGFIKDRSILMNVVYRNLSKNKKAQRMLNAKKKHSFTYIPD